jgi:spermidine/putrescine transport system permease protein
MKKSPSRDWLNAALRSYSGLLYFFLYAPIGLVVLFSFNSGNYAADLQGLSLRWYGETWRDPFVLEALRNSVFIASVSATLSTIFGALAALALQSVRGWLRTVYDALIYIAIIVPGIVIGIATLIFFVQFFGWINPILQTVLGSSAPRLNLGLTTIIAAHTLFTMSIVLVIVRARISGMDRSLIEASSDLYAAPLATFFQVTLPQLLPAILSGFLLAFTFSFDDFIVAFFVAGPNTTLPIYVFSSIRRGVTPKINTIATVTLFVTLTALFITQRLTSGGNQSRRNPDS